MSKNKFKLITLLLVLIGCSNQENSSLEKAKSIIPSPGIYTEKTLGIGQISGACEGKIALTPTNKAQSYPLVYDCQNQSFEVLDISNAKFGNGTVYGDLTFTENGYFLHESKTIDLKRVGRYLIFDKRGDLIKEVKYPYLDAHDFILDKNSFTFIQYIPNRESTSCFSQEQVPVELGISQKDFNGNSLYDYNSKNQFKIEWKVSRAELINKGKEENWKKYVRPIRHCYTTLLLKLKNFETPNLYFMEGKWPLLQLEENDYIHANSIQKINSNGDILISARHLDTIFVVNKENSHVSWSLGGSFPKCQ